MRIEVLLDIKTTLGEGPLWDVDHQRLYWVDSFDGRVFRCTVDGRELRAWDLPQKIGAMALRKDGQGAILTLQRGFHTLDFKTGEVELIRDPEPDKLQNRLNDGKVDRRGRFFAGSMAMLEDAPSASLYQLDPDFSITKVDSDIICSNGPCFSPDDKTFYFTDSGPGEIRAYDYDVATGRIGNRRLFAKVGWDDGGTGDGATVDSEGFLWTAHVYAGTIIRFARHRPAHRAQRISIKPSCDHGTRSRRARRRGWPGRGSQSYRATICCRDFLFDLRALPLLSQRPAQPLRQTSLNRQPCERRHDATRRPTCDQPSCRAR